MSTDVKKQPEIIFPDVKVNIHKPKNPVEVPIVENKIATKGASPNFIRHITFDISGTELEGQVRTGQSIGIIPEGMTEPDGKPAKVRLYSVASPTRGEDGEGKLISTTVKRLVDEDWETQDLFMGLCSNYLSSRKPGDTVKMTGPNGKKFVLPENAHDFNYIFFGTGTGIAPFRGMITDLLESGFKNEMALIFGCPYRSDLLYYDYLQQLADKHDNFHYLKSISREDPREDGSKHYVQYKLLDAWEILNPLLLNDNTLIYICGLKGMELGLYKLLAQQGYEGYLKISDNIADKPPHKWEKEDLKKNVRPSERMFLEVY